MNVLSIFSVMDKFSAIKREPCRKCGQPVFLAERFNVGDHLYHRKCLTCARCGVQLNQGDFYETENDGEYCCETCPDEEKEVEPRTAANDSASVADKVALFQRIDAELAKTSLSDEEKRSSLQRLGTPEDDDDTDASESDNESVEPTSSQISSGMSTLDRNQPETLENLMRAEIELIISNALEQCAPRIVIVETETDKPKPVPRTKRSKSTTTPTTPSPDFTFPEAMPHIEITEPVKVKPERPPKPATLTKPPIKPRPAVAKKESYPSELNPFGDDDEVESKNPFDSDDEPPKVVSTNPFGSEDEEEDVM